MTEKLKCPECDSTNIAENKCEQCFHQLEDEVKQKSKETKK